MLGTWLMWLVAATMSTIIISRWDSEWSVPVLVLVFTVLLLHVLLLGIGKSASMLSRLMLSRADMFLFLFHVTLLDMGSAVTLTKAALVSSAKWLLTSSALLLGAKYKNREIR